MSKKPALKEVLAIYKMKKEANALYDAIDERVKKIADEFGADRFDYDLGTVGIDGKQYFKFEVADNIRKMQNGEKVWKSVASKPFQLSMGLLKNCPKSLK